MALDFKKIKYCLYKNFLKNYNKERKEGIVTIVFIVCLSSSWYIKYSFTMCVQAVFQKILQ